MPFRNFLQKRSRGDFLCFKNIFFHYLKADGMALFSPVVENFKEGYVFFDFSFCMWLKNYIQCFTERYRKNKKCCIFTVFFSETLPLQPKNCLVEVIFHYIFGFKNSTTTYICVGVVVFFTAFSCKTQCAIATKKDTKKLLKK